MASRNLNSTPLVESVYNWKPSFDFSDSHLDTKKNDLSKLIILFQEVKNKRKSDKNRTKTSEEKSKNEPVAKKQKLNISDTDDEMINDESFSVKINNRIFYLPKKNDNPNYDIINDGFDIIPDLIEIIPSDDPQSIVLSKNTLEADDLDSKKKKRKPVVLFSKMAFHKISKNFIEENKLSNDKKLERSKKRKDLSILMWKEIIISNIKKKFTKHSTIFENRTKMLKTLAESSSVYLKKKFEGPSAKGIVSKARKLVYEMQTYWRKVDRDATDHKRKRSRDVISERKKIHTEKEVKRQGQRLDFLLRQTEIFSHFIGARMGINIADKDKFKNKTAIKTFDKKSEDENKAAKAAIEFMNRRKKATVAFEKKMVAISGNKNYHRSQQNKNEIGEMDLLNPSTMPSQTNIKEPKIFVGNLKSYQLKGLNWLVNLYDHSINGILADEMGLGKTIQSIAFISHLCEKENLWGPYLIIAPNSVVHNWCYEFEQFTPSIKILPYWGQQKDRETLRKFWKPNLLYSSEGEFHVMVTSYSTFQADERHFKKMKWQFIILDEAQAIKNSQSQRWKSLLSLECRNRLLLTGTPIQNSMAELWSLLHYIMPSIFQKHSEFKEWFSKNIEDHAEGKSNKLNSVQLKRLHMILKPFMLRRLKQDVENEMAPKKEVVIKCKLSPRQNELYLEIEKQFKSDFTQTDIIVPEKDLYNAVMQFRKVCNHPEIYRKRTRKTPFNFTTPLFPPINTKSEQELLKNGEFFEICDSNENPIKLTLPRRIFDHCKKFSNAKEIERNFLIRKFLIFDANYVKKSIFGDFGHSAFSFCFFNDFSFSDIENLSKKSQIYRWLYSKNLKNNPKKLKNIIFSENNQNFPNFNSFSSNLSKLDQNFLKLSKISSIFDKINQNSIWKSQNRFSKNDFNLEFLTENGVFGEFFKTEKIKELFQFPKIIRNAFINNCLSKPIEIKVSHKNFPSESLIEKTILLGSRAKGNAFLKLKKSRHFAHFIPSNIPKNRLLNDFELFNGLLKWNISLFGTNKSKIEILPKDILLTDCGKLSALNSLLKTKFEKGHRVLIFSQMTKMLDILEDYCQIQNFKFLRLDGSTPISDRTIMVKQFQRDSKIFIFLLSTRAGGLGINLTAADTVIFYDNDWNPTMDAQAMDRVHRIGQKKQVTVYRMICKNTVEERVWQVAQQKSIIQNSVYSGGFKFSKANQNQDENENVFKPTQLKNLVLNNQTQ